MARKFRPKPTAALGSSAARRQMAAADLFIYLTQVEHHSRIGVMVMRRSRVQGCSGRRRRCSSSRRRLSCQPVAAARAAVVGRKLLMGRSCSTRTTAATHGTVVRVPVPTPPQMGAEMTKISLKSVINLTRNPENHLFNLNI